MQRYAASVQYQGTRFHGWQSQKGLPTVQEAVESALSCVANHPLGVVCAGRTDRQVHATGQVIHFDSDSPRELIAWHRGANANLPPDIAINWVRPVPPEFHARFSAIAREYRFVLYNSPTRPATLHNHLTWECRQLDVEAMQSAAHYLLGEHDFSSFRGSGCQARHPIRTVHHLNIIQNQHFISVEIKANAFLLHMVRNIVGSLIRVGKGEEKPAWFERLLQAKDRRLGGITAKPDGLSLISVHYPDNFKLPSHQTMDAFAVFQ